MSDSVDYMHCPVCASKQLFETPECPDGHGAECPDRACVQCGTALSVDVSAESSAPAAPARRGRTSAA